MNRVLCVMIAALMMALTGVLSISQTDDSARERTRTANARIGILINDKAYSSATYNIRVKMALELTDELSAEGLIRNVYYDAGSKLITFEFADGSSGGIMLKDFSLPGGFLPMN